MTRVAGGHQVEELASAWAIKSSAIVHRRCRSSGVHSATAASMTASQRRRSSPQVVRWCRATLQQHGQPPLAIFGMERLVRPIEFIVVPAGFVVVVGEGFDPFVAAVDVLGFEIEDHAEPEDRFLLPCGNVDVITQWQCGRCKAPVGQPLQTHQAMPALVVGPAGQVTDKLPAQCIGKVVQVDRTDFRGPDFVQVADGAAHLQMDAVAGWEI